MVILIKKSLPVITAILLGITSMAQNAVKDIPHGWHLKDRQTSGYYGISLDKAYDFVKGKKSKTVLVAIIDSGIDTTHEDLKPVLWTNPKEIPGNGIDDDGNGYIDDIHGWNFLGGRDGRNVKEDSYEAARVYHQYKSRFSGADSTRLKGEELELYRMWKRAEKDVVTDVDINEMTQIRFIYPRLKKGDSVISKEMHKEEYSGKDLQTYNTTNPDALATKAFILGICSVNNNNFDITNRMLLDELEGQMRKAEAVDTAPRDYRGEIVGDNENDFNDKFYGNNDVMAATSMHGTHVAGIIGAARNNGKGIDGIADNVRIMMLRAVPDGDEHDKDIALAIRYAVDNGARVINMSFGKSFSPQKSWVDDAVRYAESKNVLLVHAAGNEAKDLDSSYNFPNPVFRDNGQRASNWITIGASGDPRNGGLVASFSNYGKDEVDVFAPGVNIYSSLPGGNVYGNQSGTSMASPVTAGVAAFLLEYYPTLTAQQVKNVLEKSAVVLPEKVTNPESGEQVKLSDMSRTGGLVNAYTAARLAAQITADQMKPSKSKVKVKKSRKS